MHFFEPEHRTSRPDTPPHERRLLMIRGYATVKGAVRRPRKAAIVYRKPELAVIFGALEANPGSMLFEGDVSDVSPPSVWQGGLLVKGTFQADPSQQILVRPMSDTQRLGLALLCYTHVLARTPDDSPALQRWREWAQTWLDQRVTEDVAGLREMAELDWPRPGLKYLAHAGYQIATGTVLRDLTPTVIIQAMTDLLRITDQHGLQIEEEVLSAIVQQSRTY
jgi:hypothetical protein